MIHPNTVASCTVAGWVTLSSSHLDPHGEGQLFLLLFSPPFIMKASFPTGDPAGRLFPLLKSPKRAESERLYNRSSFLRSDLYLAGADSSLRSRQTVWQTIRAALVLRRQVSSACQSGSEMRLGTVYTEKQINEGQSVHAVTHYRTALINPTVKTHAGQ